MTSLDTGPLTVDAEGAIRRFLGTVSGDLVIVGCDHPSASVWATTIAGAAETLTLPVKTHLVEGGPFALVPPESSLVQLMQPGLRQDFVTQAQTAYDQFLAACGIAGDYLIVGHGPCLQNFCCQAPPDPAHEARLLNGASSRLAAALVDYAAGAGSFSAASVINLHPAVRDPFARMIALTAADLAPRTHVRS